MELQKKNDDLASMMESTVGGSLANELGELGGDFGQNMIGNMDDSIEPEKKQYDDNFGDQQQVENDGYRNSLCQLEDMQLDVNELRGGNDLAELERSYDGSNQDS